MGESFGTVASEIISSLQDAGTWQDAAASGPFGGLSAITSPILMIFILIMMGYAVIKVFFANLKRGGILLVMMAAGLLPDRLFLRHGKFKEKSRFSQPNRLFSRLSEIGSRFVCRSVFVNFAGGNFKNA